MTFISRHHIKNFRRPESLCYAIFLPLCLFAAALGILLPAQAAAATETNPSSQSLEEARWFQVELILFAQKRGEPLESEQWPEIEGLELPENLLELTLPPRDPATAEAGPDSTPADSTQPGEPVAEPAAEFENNDENGLPIAYQILDEDAMQLTEIAERLRRSSRFSPLLHIAWQQPTNDREHSQPVFFMEGMSDPLPVETTEDPTAQTEQSLDTPLALGLEYASEADTEIGPPDPQFAGTVTLSVERYLHFAADLVYRQPVRQHMAVPISDLDLWYDRPYPTLREPQGPAYQLESWQAQRGFRLVESRRMRSKEIHYLDHPFMGLVVVITPVELPEPAEEIQQTSPQNILTTPGKP